LPERIENGQAVVSIFGLGRVGLPLAIVIARSGLRVIGVDVDESKIAKINKGEMPFYYPAMQEWLGEVVASRKLVASTHSKESIEQSDVIIVTVGTPTGSRCELDYSQIHSVLNEVGKANLKNKAVIIRSTSVPGTLANIVMPLLFKATGLRPGVDFGLAVCPERIVEGQAHRELYEVPEIVGGTGDLSNVIALQLFKRINPQKKILILAPTGAELAKLFTNIYRYVQFALANEFAIWAERYGEDAHQIIQAANESYPRSSIPRPGFAGGPCLAKDGLLLDNNTTYSSIVSVAWKLNEAVPQHVVTQLMKEMGSLYGMKIAVLGLAFKANSDDVRSSPSVKLIETLKGYGAEVLVHDPYVKDTMSLSDALKNPEVVVIANNHSAFKNLAGKIDSSGCQIVYDVWGIFEASDFTRARYKRFGSAK